MLTLYELRGLDDLRYSSFSWRSRMALAHKKLRAEFLGVRISDKAAIAFSGQDKVPILRDGNQVIVDSWRIAEHLEDRYPDAPSLFGGETGRALARFFNVWVDRTILPAIATIIACDLPACMDEEDGAHLRVQMEKGLGATLEDLRARQPESIKALKRPLDLPRAVLKSQPFISGAEPKYADYILFSVIQWARIVSSAELFGKDDVLAAWRERMLDLHDGFARSMPARAGPDKLCQ